MNLHLFEIDEDHGACTHWVAARTSVEALQVLRDTLGDDVFAEADSFEVDQIDDDRTWSVHYVDGWDDDCAVSEQMPPGASWEMSENGLYPIVTALAGDWARWAGRPCYEGSSEW